MSGDAPSAANRRGNKRSAETDNGFLSAIQRLQDLELNDSSDEQNNDEFEVVPPGQQIPMRSDQVCASQLTDRYRYAIILQVQNNAGGFVFEVSDETRIRRFLILGTTSATYYVSGALIG